MLYENENNIAIFTTKKCFYEVFHFYKTIFFTKAYEKFSCASAAGAYGRRSICFCNFGICNFLLLPQGLGCQRPGLSGLLSPTSVHREPTLSLHSNSLGGEENGLAEKKKN